MHSKRQTLNPPAAPASNSGPALDPYLHQQLATVGRRARKHVSDGHQTQGTSIPSYQGDTVGSLNPSAIKMQVANARPFHTTDETYSRLKRDRNALDADDGGDTDEDEPMEDLPNKPTSFSDLKAFYIPGGHRSHSQPTDDFEEAAFLQPPPP